MEASDNESLREVTSSNGGDVTSKRSFRSNTTIEPIVFLSYIARSIATVVTDNLLQEKICETFYHGSQYNCSNYIVTYNGTITVNAIQRYASNYNMYIACLTIIPEILLIVLLGPWSDTHGRKLTMMLPLIGGALSSAIYAVVTLTDIVKPQYIIASKIPDSLGGGSPLLMMSCLSYLSDVTEKNDRTLRIAILDGVLTVALPMGTLIGSQIYSHYGYASVYVASTTLYVSTLFYVTVCIVNIKPNKLNAQQQEPNSTLDTKDKTNKCYDVFQLSNVTNNFQVCFKRRDGNLRTIILLLLLGSILNTLNVYGELQMMFLYTRKRYGWNVSTYSQFQSFTISMSSIGMFFLMPLLSRKLNVKDSTFGIVGNSFKFVGGLVKTFSYKPILLWTAGGMEMFGGFAYVINRAMLSKCVPSSDIGKVFAVDGIITSLVPMVAAIVYTQTYKMTLATFPSAVFLITATSSFVIIIIFSSIHYSMKKNPIPKT